MWSGSANLVDNQFRSFHLGLNVMERNCFTPNFMACELYLNKVKKKRTETL